MYDFKLDTGTFTVVSRAEFDAGIWRQGQPPHVLIVWPDVDLERVRRDYLEGLMRTSVAQHQRWAHAGNPEPAYTCSVLEPKAPNWRIAYYGLPVDDVHTFP